MAAQDKHWKSVIDPLIEPQPSEETGPHASMRYNGTEPFPGSSSSSTKTPDSSIRVREQTTGGSTLSSNNPFRSSTNPPSYTGSPIHSRQSSLNKGGVPGHARQVSSGSAIGHRPRGSSDLRHAALHSYDNAPQRRSADFTEDSPKSNGKANGHRPRRSSSLRQRYPGDPTDHPLDMLEKDNKLANRSPHLRKKHQPRPDSVDILDDSAPNYHHEGPYDAALFARNSVHTISPVAALEHSNAEALKATPEDKIRDSLNDHRPLDGTAIVPPGVPDKFGRVYNYEEGADLMREDDAEGGPYKRWPGVEYLPEDLKGKGEPSYSIEEALKNHKGDRQSSSGGYAGQGAEFELAERPRHSDGPNRTSTGQSYTDWENENRNSGHGRNFSGDLKKRIGSLRKKDK